MIIREKEKNEETVKNMIEEAEHQLATISERIRQEVAIYDLIEIFESNLTNVLSCWKKGAS